MAEFLKKNWKIILFAGVIALAIFLRVWHFHDWLFFKMDQARDALLAKKALENGIGWLPLLGPKAGGTTVNLGPAFYYFQYLAAFIFQSAHPAVLAYPDLIFATLSIPLFYFFLKRYFSRDWSMILTALYAFCFLAVEYSRFAWNPNSLVFFNLLYFYALLNIFDESVKYKLRWVIIAGFSAAVSTQLHFLSLATLPATTIVFIVMRWKDAKKYLNWKKILIFFAFVLLVYAPFIISDIITHGKNTTAFIAAVKSKPSHHSLWKNFCRDIRYWGQYWLLILTSYISKKGELIPSFIAWLGVMIPGLILAIRNYRKEKNETKKNFLLISILWFVAYFLIYIPISYQIRPRFFLPILSMPFVFVGFISVYLWEKKSKILKFIVAALLFTILVGNIIGTYLWLSEIGPSKQKAVYPKRTIILIARDGIVLWHLEKALDYIQRDCPNSRVYASANSEYKTPVRYMFIMRNLQFHEFGEYDGSGNGCFYAFGLTRNKKFSLDSKADYNVILQEKIGALTVYKLQPKPDVNFVPKNEEEGISKRIFWKDVFK